MNYTALMAVEDTRAQLYYNLAHICFFHAAVRSHVLQKFTTACILHYHNQLLLFEEGVVELDDVFVPQFFQVAGFFEDALDLVGSLKLIVDVHELDCDLLS